MKANGNGKKKFGKKGWAIYRIHGMLSNLEQIQGELDLGNVDAIRLHYSILDQVKPQLKRLAQKVQQAEARCWEG